MAKSLSEMTDKGLWNTYVHSLRMANTDESGHLITPERIDAIHDELVRRNIPLGLDRREQLRRRICIIRTCKRMPSHQVADLGDLCRDHAVLLIHSPITSLLEPSVVTERQWEIWSEGFRATGESGIATLLGTAHAATFKDACAAYAKVSVSFASSYTSDPHPAHWGCRLYPTEQEARAAYG